MSTAENLLAAFAGESKANRMYLAFARKADTEGLKQIARLFRAAAEAETVHALAHFRVTGNTKSTVENLQAAIKGEAYEFEQMYPRFVSEAQSEGNQAATVSFNYAMAVEKVHHALYSAALQAAESGQDLPAAPIHICSVCGHTVVGDAPDRCEVCHASKKSFMEVK